MFDRLSPCLHGVVAALMILSPTMGGCASRQAANNTGGTPEAVLSQTQPAPTRTDLEQLYVIGPGAARALGYRIDWQEPTTPIDASGIRVVEAQRDSVFVLDGRNYLTRLRVRDGRRVWRIPVADPGREVYGVTYVPEVERVFLTTGGSVLVLDADTGSPVDRQDLEKVANTAPALYGDFLIYGSRDGQLIWHSYGVAFQARAYQIGRTIQVRPIIEDDLVIVVASDRGGDGRVMVLTAASGSQLWSQRLLDAIECPPVVGNDLVYVAGRDQYLRAFEIDRDRTAWKTLTTSPLTDSPTVIGDHVYQQVPTEGLMCFEAAPIDAPGGRVVWVSQHTTGSVLTRSGETLLAWDGQRRQLKLVSAGSGAVIETVELPQVDMLLASAVSGGNLLAVCNDGRVLRLVPR